MKTYHLKHLVKQNMDVILLLCIHIVFHVVFLTKTLHPYREKEGGRRKEEGGRRKEEGEKKRDRNN
jgi:hypothetical protein